MKLVMFLFFAATAAAAAPGEKSACPVGCAIAHEQLNCKPQNGVLKAEGGVVQYAGRASLPPSGQSAIRCGTLDETQACPEAWGIRYMDIEFPRFWFDAEKKSASEIRVRARYSWNGANSDKSLPPFFNTFTAILERVEARLYSPTGALLAESHRAAGRPGLNYGGFLYKADSRCNVRRFDPGAGSDMYFEFELTLVSQRPVPEGSSVEVRAIGNYE
ncbi:MAG TPA: hypothetical protein VFV50_05815 [Bdellovibrionales bacterium]|nr:hypothetical protein [Bdellovibrionales bacterium]